ncbi:hypothetical protein F66182_4672 [Fusarium sp. NRRL 66182]|nr:hypothetical protein F66182_4672 [Fusarium sp. NRRL 66182]
MPGNEEELEGSSGGEGHEQTALPLTEEAFSTSTENANPFRRNAANVNTRNTKNYLVWRDATPARSGSRSSVTAPEEVLKKQSELIAGMEESRQCTPAKSDTQRGEASAHENQSRGGTNPTRSADNTQANVVRSIQDLDFRVVPDEPDRESGGHLMSESTRLLRSSKDGRLLSGARRAALEFGRAAQGSTETPPRRSTRSGTDTLQRANTSGKGGKASSTKKSQRTSRRELPDHQNRTLAVTPAKRPRQASEAEDESTDDSEEHETDTSDEKEDGDDEGPKGEVSITEIREDGLQCPDEIHAAHSNGPLGTEKKSVEKVRKDIQRHRGKDKDKVPVVAFETMIRYSFDKIGLSYTKYPKTYERTVDYLASTNVFKAQNWSGWSGQKRLDRETSLLGTTALRYPNYVLTLSPDISLCTMAVVDLRPVTQSNPSGRCITAMYSCGVWDYIRHAVKVSETLDWDDNYSNRLLMIGRRVEDVDQPLGSGENETDPRKGIAKAERNPTPPGELTVMPQDHALEPFPYPDEPDMPPMILTAQDWEQSNAHWLVKIGKKGTDNAELKPYIEENVTRDTMPVINKYLRGQLQMWMSFTNYPFDEDFFKIPGRKSICIRQTGARSFFNRETDATRRVIREMETLVLASPPPDDITLRMKRQTDLLFAYRDHEINVFRLMLEGLFKPNPPSVVTATELSKAFAENEGNIQARRDAHEIMQADMQKAQMPIGKGGNQNDYAEKLVALLTEEGRMPMHELNAWRMMAQGLLRAVSTANQHIKVNGPDGQNYTWSILLTMATYRGGRPLVALLELDRQGKPSKEFDRQQEDWKRIEGFEMSLDSE